MVDRPQRTVRISDWENTFRMIAGVVMSGRQEMFLHSELCTILPLCCLMNLVCLSKLSLGHVRQALVQRHIVPLLGLVLMVMVLVLLVVPWQLQLNIYKAILIWENSSSVLPWHGNCYIPPEPVLVCQDVAPVPTLHVPGQKPLPPARHLTTIPLPADEILLLVLRHSHPTSLL